MIDYATLPERLRGGVQRYLEHGVQPGDFLTAIICNDLRQAITRADPWMMGNLRSIVLWFHWEAPGTSWGSPERMRAWMRARREEAAEKEDMSHAD